VSYDGYENFANQFGHVFYKDPFSHYRLRLEYRFIGEAMHDTEGWAIRNSGAMLHSQDPLTMPPAQDFPISLEFQFLGRRKAGEDRPTGNMCSPGTDVFFEGKLAEDHCINSTSPTFDGEQWVQAEALVLGNDRVVQFINGEAVIEYTDFSYGGGVVSGHDPAQKPDGQPLDSGYISLQSEGHAIQFRNIELLDLKGCMDSQSDRYRSHFVESAPERCD